MKINKKYLTVVALIWAGCFILFVLAYMVVLAPQQKSKKQVENQYTETKQIYDSVVKASQEETKARLNQEIENLRNQLKDFAVDFEASPNLTFDISQIANERKVDSFNIKTQEDSRGPSGPELKHIKQSRIDISFTSDFNQFATFLNALERHRPVVFVNNFKITRSTTGDSNHRANMKLAVFVRKQQS